MTEYNFRKWFCRIFFSVAVIASVAALMSVGGANRHARPKNREVVSQDATPNQEPAPLNNDKFIAALQNGFRPSYVGADNGTAIVFDERDGATQHLKTSMPVFKAFGLSSKHASLLYSPLKNRIPSGQLYVENLKDGTARRITDDLILEAELSPNESEIAYTFATAEGFGLTIIKVDSEQKENLVSENVLPDFLQWDISGKAIFYFETTNEINTAGIIPHKISVRNKRVEQMLKNSTPHGFPKSSFEFKEASSQPASLLQEVNVEINYPFEVTSPNGANKICGINLFGDNSIFLCNQDNYLNSAGEFQLAKGQVIKVLNRGLIVRSFEDDRTTTDFISWGGNKSRLAVSPQVSYNLPLSSFIMTQGGSGYPSTSACTSGHTGNTAFAYDMQNQTVGKHVLASAEGLVVNTFNTVNCNSLDTNGCVDYNVNCAPNNNNGGWGNTVIIQHSDSTYSRYAHLQFNSVRVAVNASACQGLYLGNQGHTGNSAGNLNGCGDHLHFQKQSAVMGASISVSFSDTSNPLACSASYASGSSETTTCSTVTPPNDNCSNAILLSSNTACNFTSGTVLNATASGLPKPSCDAFSNPNMFDVWYRFIAVASSQMVAVDPSTSGGDPVVSAYSSCSGSPFGCSDVGGTGVTENLSLSGLTVGNTYYVRIYDYGSIEPTGSDANFQICITGTPISGLPDLTITAGTQFVTPTTVAVGSNVTAGCSEDNSGTSTAAANVVSLYLSTDAVLTPGSNGDTNIGLIQFPSIPAGSNSPVNSSNIQIPSGTATGTYFLFFWADGGQVVNETNENNNFATRQLTVTAGPVPTITASVTSLPDFGNLAVGQNSVPKSYTVSGSNLSSNISIQAPTGFQISLSSTTGFTSSLNLAQSGGSVPTTTIYARFSPQVSGTQTGNISHTSSGATTRNVSVSGTGTTSTIPVTVQTSPSGRSFTVDGTTYTSAQPPFNWTSGSSHTISTTSVQNGSAGIRYVWSNWSDSGAISHTVAPTSATTYTANFDTGYQLTINSSPSNGGITSPPSNNYYFPSQSIAISATANSGYIFSGWTGTGSGSYSGTNNPASITTNGPITQTANFSAVPNGRKPFDFDGDGKADVSVYRPTNGTWYFSNSSNGAFNFVQFGVNGDLIAPADFDGDGKTDVSVFRPSNGTWYRLNSSNNVFVFSQFGQSGDIPVPGDFDGDGRADISIFRPSNGTWYRVNSSDGQFVFVQFGANGDKPQVGDFDGDQKTDLAVFRPSTNVWHILRSSDGSYNGTAFGQAGDIATQADYDGDGTADISVFRPSNGTWYRLNSSNGQFAFVQFGTNGDVPTAADFDGDGKADPTVFRQSNGYWYSQRSTAGFVYQQFGASGDVPTPAAFGR